MPLNNLKNLFSEKINLLKISTPFFLGALYREPNKKYVLIFKILLFSDIKIFEFHSGIELYKFYKVLSIGKQISFIAKIFPLIRFYIVNTFP